MAFYPVAPLPDVNSRQPAITLRQPSTSLLTVDSEDRFQDYLAARGDASGNFQLNASPYNFSITKPESMMNGFFTRIGISEVCFPWAIPNINAKTQTMYYSYQIGAAPPVVAQLLTLDNGFHTPFEIAAAIEQLVQADLPTFTMAYAPDGLSNPSFVYSAGAGNQIAFVPMAYNTSAYPYPSTTKQLFDLLGFTNANSDLLGGAGGNYTFCQAIRYVDIVCNVLTNQQSLKDQTTQIIARDMLCRLYLGDGNLPANISASDSSPDFCPPGCAPFTIYRNFATPKQIQWIPNQPIPGYLQFQVYDDAGALLSESTGLSYNSANQYGNLDWSMTMQVTEN